MEICKDGSTHPGVWVAYNRPEERDPDVPWGCPMCLMESRIKRIEEERDMAVRRMNGYEERYTQLMADLKLFDVPLPTPVAMQRRIDTGHTRS